MKIIHCADLHLDSKLSANLDREKAKERKREILDTFVRMVDYASNNGVEAILICGDLFDTRNISALTRNTFKDKVVTNPGIEFFYLRGNHDSDNLLNSFEEIPDNLHFFGDNWTSYKVGRNGRIVIYGAELNADNSQGLQMNFAPDPSDINIVMLHGQESESKGTDKAEIIGLKYFRNKGLNYLALGHVHEYKSEQLDGACRYCYPGCLEGRGFDETGEHGFVLLDVNEETGTVKDTFVPFAYRHIYDVYADVSGNGSSNEMVETVKVALGQSPAVSTDLVKVILTGDVDVECEKDTEYIKHIFENDYYFLKVYDKTVTRIRPEDFLLDSSLKGEFVRSVLSDDSLLDDEKGEIVRIGLSVLMGGEI